MNQTVVFHINYVHPLLASNTEYFHLSDCIKYQKEKIGKIHYVDFYDADTLTRVPQLNVPFKNLILSSTLIIDDHKVKDEVNKVSNTIFVALKNSYKLLMQQKNLKLWILEPVISLTHKKYLPEVNSFKAGVRAISSIVALELARKKINVNYLENCNHSPELLNLLRWSENQDLMYLTAQNLIINDNPKNSTNNRW